MADKRWQSEYAARLARNVSRRKGPKTAVPEVPRVAAEPARAAGGFAAYSRGTSRKAPSDGRALAELMGVIKLAKASE